MLVKYNIKNLFSSSTHTNQTNFAPGNVVARAPFQILSLPPDGKFISAFSGARCLASINTNPSRQMANLFLISLFSPPDVFQMPHTPMLSKYYI